VVDLCWVVLQCAHDLKRARKGQSYQWGTPPAKTSGAAHLPRLRRRLPRS